ncbi:MAG: UDP-N-acetylglucosamine--N-acetylmuramyl-(pentapeptide) pyrophosphoryl-undecaprenol N-acetylglucosamine transferase [Candidatus Paceibacterota bacterium]|jgi:UDP-N-acetylglucosamine--N-acetylmuramyl-(pentapeptide) pyrophosphoryl-undecaprenol N-acetylglucosamine transferase|nr:UDP-N-acetylglucosamine--N-acetylmuramyl-(pentapeptide) pyrophosphoryl-undecaprenol N-acetylglucosamine transferase [Candidatus Paceibacterota bacterium]
MKILFTGGGSGGHFYPIIAVAEAIQEVEQKERLLPSDLYFISNEPYDKELLFNHNINFIEITTGKRRTYFSLLNISDVFKTFFAVLRAMKIVFSIYPDIVFSKGGFAAYPTLVAARFFRIPVLIHESDTVPGRVNKWASKFAQYVAVSYPDAVTYFPEKKTVVTGNPIRKEIMIPLTQGSFKFLELEEGVPVILILGGSQGSQTINEAILDALPFLLDKYQILHQVGNLNKKEIDTRLETILQAIPHRSRYKTYPYLNDLTLRMCAGVADLIISRAGSTIFEIASWGKGSIIIPITNSNGDHQRKNAFHYARSGSAFVIEEQNLTPHLLAAEIDRYMNNPQLRKGMEDSAKKFGEYNATAAEAIARQLLRVSLRHEA